MPHKRPLIELVEIWARPRPTDRSQSWGLVSTGSTNGVTGSTNGVTGSTNGATGSTNGATGSTNGVGD